MTKRTYREAFGAPAPTAPTTPIHPQQNSGTLSVGLTPPVGWAAPAVNQNFQTPQGDGIVATPWAPIQGAQPLNIDGSPIATLTLGGMFSPSPPGQGVTIDPFTTPPHGIQIRTPDTPVVATSGDGDTGYESDSENSTSSGYHWFMAAPRPAPAAVAVPNVELTEGELEQLLQLLLATPEQAFAPRTPGTIARDNLATPPRTEEHRDAFSDDGTTSSEDSSNDLNKDFAQETLPEDDLDLFGEGSGL